MIRLFPRLPVHHSSPAVEYVYPNRWGTSLKFAIRRYAKKLPEYHLPVQLIGYEEKPLIAKSDDGDEIPINTLGRWLFGTPGYAGHIIVESFEKDRIVVRYPSEAPVFVRTLLEKAIELLIKEEKEK